MPTKYLEDLIRPIMLLLMAIIHGIKRQSYGQSEEIRIYGAESIRDLIKLMLMALASGRLVRMILIMST